MPNGKNDSNHPFVRKPGSDEDLDGRQAAHEVLMEQRGGHYSDRIKREPYSNLDKTMRPKQRIKRA